MKVALLCSGGVDSAVALHLLKEKGYHVEAFYLKVWNEDDWGFGECPWEEDIKYLEQNCAKLGIEYRVLAFQDTYKARILDYMLQELHAGCTPNPDVLCNSRIKFGAFLEYLSEKEDLSFAKVASGHYAHLCELRLKEGEEPLYFLQSSPDELKDQSYFLAQLSQAQLGSLLFPLATYTKAEVRELAQSLGLASAYRKDSQGLCFLGKLSFKDFLKKHIGERKGPLVEQETGVLLGEHSGFWFYTIGQRRGLRLSGGPWYVTGKDIASNAVYVSSKAYKTRPLISVPCEYKCLPSQENRQPVLGDFFWVRNMHWILPSYKITIGDSNIWVKLRHGPGYYACSILDCSQEGGIQSLAVCIHGEDQGIATGQFAVFYQRTVDVYNKVKVNQRMLQEQSVLISHEGQVDMYSGRKALAEMTCIASGRID